MNAIAEFHPAPMSVAERSPQVGPAARVSRVWWLALALSAVAHAVLLFGLPPIEFGARDTVLTKPLEARIVQAAPTPPLAAPPEAVKPAPPKPAATPKPRPKARPQPAARPQPPPPIALPDPTPPLAQADEAAPPHDDVIDAPNASSMDVAAAQSGTGTSPGESPPAATGAAVGPVPAAAAAAATPGPPARYPLRSATLVYDLSFGETPMRVGRVTHQWNNDGERYFAETVVEATGLFAVLYGGQYVQRSWGTFGAAGLVPSEYYVQRGGPERAETASFDWEARNVAFHWRNERRNATLVAGTQDPISMLHQIYYMQPLPQAKTLNVASSRKFGTYLFQFIGEERIDTPMGELTALHVRRKDDDADHVDVWVDPQRGFLPVRVHFVDRRGYVFDQRVREMRFEAAP